MSHEITFHNGTAAFASNSAHEAPWHGEGERCAWRTVDDMIASGIACNAMPTRIYEEQAFTASGLAVPRKAIVASYAHRPDRCVSVAGGKYRALLPAELCDLYRAAGQAGAIPSAIMSLAEGTKTIASFEIASDKRFKTYLNVADSLDGSLACVSGASVTRVVCQNTCNSWLHTDGKRAAKLRHTSGMADKLPMMRRAIQDAIKTGDSVRKLYDAATSVRLTGTAASLAFSALFPEAKQGASRNAVTRAENDRDEARRAARLDINREGGDSGNLATLYNAATFLADREIDGSWRGTRKGSDPLASQMVGSRQSRFAEIEQTIRTIVEVVRADGTIEAQELAEALRMGIDPAQAGALDLIASGPDPRAAAPVPAAPVPAASFTLDDLLA